MSTSLKKLRDRTTWATRLIGGLFGMPVYEIRECPVCFHQEETKREVPQKEVEKHIEKEKKIYGYN